MESSGKFELALNCPESVILSASLRTMEDRRVENACLVMRDGRTARVLVSFPETGPYTLVVFGGPWTEKSVDMEGLLEVVVVNHGTGVAPPAYPTFFTDFFQNQCRLLEPVAGTLEKGTEVTFRLLSPGSGRIVFIVEGRLIPLERDAAGVYSGKMLIPDTKELSLYMQDGSRGYKGIVRYEVR